MTNVYEMEARAAATLESGEYMTKLHDTRVKSLIRGGQWRIMLFEKPLCPHPFGNQN